MIRYLSILAVVAPSVLAAQIYSDTPPNVRSGECLATYDVIRSDVQVYSPSEYWRAHLEDALRSIPEWMPMEDKNRLKRAYQSKLEAISGKEVAFEVFEGSSEKKSIRIPIQTPFGAGERRSWIIDFSTDNDHKVAARFEIDSPGTIVQIIRNVIWSETGFTSQTGHAYFDSENNLTGVSEGAQYEGTISCSN